MPFEGTALGDYCKKNNLINGNIGDSFYSSMIHELPTIKKEKVLSFARLFELYVKLPQKYYFIPNLFMKIMSNIKMPLFHRYSHFATGKITKMLLRLI